MPLTMTISELEALISGGESPQVEFKLSTGQRSDGAKTACAMLNGNGGRILFGVDDAGRLRGMTVTTRTVDDVVHELRRIEPLPAIYPERVPIGGGCEIIVVSVPGSPGGPYTYDGRPYARLGSSTMAMPQDRYRQLLLERTHPAARWEM